jgi:hypothetical protein
MNKNSASSKPVELAVIYFMCLYYFLLDNPLMHVFISMLFYQNDDTISLLNHLGRYKDWYYIQFIDSMVKMVISVSQII